jgi:hypothetical protein
MKVDTDYFGGKRVSNKPFRRPIESPADGTREIKVWPKPRADSKQAAAGKSGRTGGVGGMGFLLARETRSICVSRL